MFYNFVKFPFHFRAVLADKLNKTVAQVTPTPTTTVPEVLYAL